MKVWEIVFHYEVLLRNVKFAEEKLMQAITLNEWSSARIELDEARDRAREFKNKIVIEQSLDNFIGEQ